MPRPSLKAERTKEILDAIERCVIRDGINGATLENIAEEAGMRRSLLRHNIGNREQLIEAFLDRFFNKSSEEVSQMLDSLPKTNRISVLLDYLFDENYTNSQLALVALALTTAASSHENIRQRLRDWNKEFVSTFARELQASFSASSSDDCYEVAAGLVGIYFNNESLTPLGKLPDLRKASKNAAVRLVSTLNATNEKTSGDLL